MKLPYPVIPRKFRLIIWIAAIIGPIVLVMASINYLRDIALLDSGSTAEGTIHSFRAEPSTKGREIYKFEVTWQDEPSGQKYRKRFSTSSAIWTDGPPQNTVKVLYDPNNPARSVIGIGPKPNNEPIFLGVFFTVVGGLALAFMLYSTKKNGDFMNREFGLEK